MTNESKLDFSRLENVRERGNRIISRCPACAEIGGDKQHDNLMVFESGLFACAAYQGDREHSSRILQLAGAKTDWRPDAPPSPKRERVGADDLELKKARKRALWPAMRPLVRSEVDAVAKLRSLPVGAVVAACRMGFLLAGEVDGHSCWIIRERAFAQASRFDGGKLPVYNGDPVRKKNLPGSTGEFIGRYRLGGDGVRVLMVEGVVGLLEALAAHDIADPVDGWCIVAATSAVAKFEKDRDMLERLSGRQVRILADPGAAGEKGAGSWLIELERVGCTVDARMLPDGIKDLGPLVACPNDHQSTLKDLFS
jgi:hypothetical protein